jgi:hypothetical protein
MNLRVSEQTVYIEHKEQSFLIYWDEVRNALKIIDTNNNGKLCVFPSSNNGILIQSVKQ